jgi:hypothetical protein
VHSLEDAQKHILHRNLEKIAHQMDSPEWRSYASHKMTALGFDFDLVAQPGQESQANRLLEGDRHEQPTGEATGTNSLPGKRLKTARLFVARPTLIVSCTRTTPDCPLYRLLIHSMIFRRREIAAPINFQLKHRPTNTGREIHFML